VKKQPGTSGLLAATQTEPKFWMSV
jgi:hypothetical protein